MPTKEAVLRRKRQLWWKQWVLRTKPQKFIPGSSTVAKLPGEMPLKATANTLPEKCMVTNIIRVAKDGSSSTSTPKAIAKSMPEKGVVTNIIKLAKEGSSMRTISKTNLNKEKCMVNASNQDDECETLFVENSSVDVYKRDKKEIYEMNKEKINASRRDIYETSKEKRNARRRALYAIKKGDVSDIRDTTELCEGSDFSDKSELDEMNKVKINTRRREIYEISKEKRNARRRELYAMKKDSGIRDKSEFDEMNKKINARRRELYAMKKCKNLSPRWEEVSKNWCNIKDNRDERTSSRPNSSISNGSSLFTPGLPECSYASTEELQLSIFDNYILPDDNVTLDSISKPIVKKESPLDNQMPIKNEPLDQDSSSISLADYYSEVDHVNFTNVESNNSTEEIIISAKCIKRENNVPLDSVIKPIVKMESSVGYQIRIKEEPFDQDTTIEEGHMNSMNVGSNEEPIISANCIETENNVTRLDSISKLILKRKLSVDDRIIIKEEPLD